VVVGNGGFPGNFSLREVFFSPLETFRALRAMSWAPGPWAIWAVELDLGAGLLFPFLIGQTICVHFRAWLLMVSQRSEPEGTAPDSEAVTGWPFSQLGLGPSVGGIFFSP
jgi:hypothetical protein